MAFIELAWDSFYMPMDFVVMVEWKDIMKEIFPMAFGNLLKLLAHLFNSFHILPATEPLKNDIVETKA